MKNFKLVFYKLRTDAVMVPVSITFFCLLFTHLFLIGIRGYLKIPSDIDRILIYIGFYFFILIIRVVQFIWKYDENQEQTEI